MSPTERTRACLALWAALLIVSGAVAKQPHVEFVMTDSTIIATAAKHANANELANGYRAQDEIVLVDVRGMGCSCDPNLLAERTRVSIFASGDASGCRRWMSSDLASAISQAPSRSTVVFVHGNRLSPWDAKQEGLAVYRRMACQATTAEPIRFVIFSWPSTEVPGLLRDVREKAARTGPAGCQLAWVVDQMPAETPLTMVGFSFGARIVTGALHMLGGGSMGHRTLDLQHPERRPANVVLLAAAVHSDWLCPGRCHGLAMTQVNEMLLVNNPADRAMKYYRFVTKRGNPQALGYCGPTCIDSANASKIAKRNVAGYVGSDHDLFCYIRVPGVIAGIWELADTSSSSGIAGL
jgi:hypothetical protein